jgi:hypothetical protein
MQRPSFGRRTTITLPAPYEVSQDSSISSFDAARVRRKEYIIPGKSAFHIFSDPRNVLVILMNVITFIAMETVFFWYVSSKYATDVLAQKAQVVVDYTELNPEFKKTLIDQLNSEYSTKTLPVEAAKLAEQRNKTNTALVGQYVFPVLVVLLILIVLNILRLAFKKEGLRVTDILLLSLVLFGFTTELYIYATITRNLQYLGNQELFYTMINGYREGIEAGDRKKAKGNKET